MFFHKMSRLVLIVLLVAIVLSLNLVVSGQNETPFVGIDYGPFRADQSPEGLLPSEDEITQDLQRIAAAGFSTIRIYGAGDLSEMIVRLADKAGLKVIIQAWISSDDDKNKQELNAAIELATTYNNVVELIVGSEVLKRNELTADELLKYIQQVRASVRSSVTVSYADIYIQWAQHTELAKAVDRVGLNSYPFLSCEKVETAVAFVMRQWDQLQQIPDYKGKTIVMETGWSTKGTPEGCGEEQGSETAQATYVADIIREAQTKGVTIFLREFADEPWKCFTSDEPGFGCHWGLLDVDRNPKSAWEVVTHPSSPELTSAPSNYHVASDAEGVNCRATPNFAGDVVTSIDNNTLLEINESNDEECWYSVQVDGSTCWVYGYLIVDASNDRLCSVPPPTPIPTVALDKATVPLQTLIDNANLSLCFGYDSLAIQTNSWAAINSSPPDLEKAESCLRNMQQYLALAKNQQTTRLFECNRIPQGPEHSLDFQDFFQKYNVLSDVSVAYWVAALVLRDNGYLTASHEAAQIILNDYSCTMIWDPRGFFWSPAQGVRDRGL